jgi:hypothetical protein
MANKDKHFIHKLIFETNVSNKDDYRNISERISNLVRYTLAEMLSRLFEKLSIEGDDLIIIDRIEIDLGHISKNQLEEQIYRTLLSNLERYIRKLNDDIPSIAQMAKFYQWRSGAIEYKSANYKIIRKKREKLFQLEDRIYMSHIQEIDLVNWQTKYAEVLKFYLKAGYIPSNVYLGDLEIKDILKRYVLDSFQDENDLSISKIETRSLKQTKSSKISEISESLKIMLKDPIARERFIKHSVQDLLSKMEERKLITHEEVEKLIKPIAYHWIDILYARFSRLESLDWMEEHKDETIDKVLYQLYNHKPSAIQNLMYRLKADLKKNPADIKDRVLFLFNQMNKGSIQKVISAIYSKGSYIQTYLNKLSRILDPIINVPNLDANKIAHFGLISFFLASSKTSFDQSEFIDYLQQSLRFNASIKDRLENLKVGKRQQPALFEFKERKFVKVDWIDVKEGELQLIELFTHLIKYGSLPLYNPLKIQSLAEFENRFINLSRDESKSIILSFKRISDQEITRNSILSRLSIGFYAKIADQIGFRKEFIELFKARDNRAWFKAFIDLISTNEKIIAEINNKLPEQEKWRNKHIQKFAKLLASKPEISTYLIRPGEKANFILFLLKKKVEDGSSFNFADALLNFINSTSGVSYKEITKQFSKVLERLTPELERLEKEQLDQSKSADNTIIIDSDKKYKEEDLVPKAGKSPDEKELRSAKEVQSGLTEAEKDELIKTLIPEEKLIITPAKSNIEKDKLKIPYQSETFESDIAVRNAGLILCWPFLGYYFGALGLLNDKKDFIDLEARERAVFLLQYLAVKQSNAEEHYLTLNKIMVGYPLDEAISTGIIMTKKEIDISEALLINVIKQWSALKNMKPDGLRGSFIIRDGVLRQMHNGWRLIVDKKGFDLLLNKIPWSLSMIRFTWVSYMINVEWN